MTALTNSVSRRTALRGLGGAGLATALAVGTTGRLSAHTGYATAPVRLAASSDADPAGRPDRERGGQTGAAETTECCAPGDTIRECGHCELLLSVCSLGQFAPRLPAHLALL